MRSIVLCFTAAFALLLNSCGEPRRVEVPYSFLDSLGIPFDTNLVLQTNMVSVFEVNRKQGESVELIMPSGGTQQSTTLYAREYKPGIEDNSNVIADKGCGPHEEMVYDLDTLTDGRYAMWTTGDGYGGCFFVEITTK